VSELAREVFEQVGNQLKMRRFQDDVEIMDTRLESLKAIKCLPDEFCNGSLNDPAEHDQELDKKLQENKRIAQEKQKKVLIFIHNHLLS
jgi:hypothetical protein